MPPWSETDLDLNGGRLRVYRTGRPGAQTVLFAHGLTDNARYWTRTVEALEPDYDLVLYDARGHGASSAVPDPFDEDARVNDLLALVEALALDHPVFIGHSMGAATVSVAAARRPSLPRAVVVEDPPWLDVVDSAAEQRDYMAQWHRDLLALQNAPREIALAKRRADAPDWSEIDQSLSLDAKRQADPRVLERYQLARTPWREAVSGITGPLLLFTGEPTRGAYVTPALAREVCDLAPAARWVHLAGAGHSARFGRFEPYLAALQQFLREVT